MTFSYLQGIGYSLMSIVGLGALLKGTSAMDDGAGKGGFQPATLWSQGQRSNHLAIAAPI